MKTIDIIRTALSLKRVATQAKWSTRLAPALPLQQPCLVLGNGPSLDGDIRNKLAEFGRFDTLCVARFAESDLYATLRPKYYVFADPMFWSPQAPPETVSVRHALYEHIARDTVWPVSICVPFEALAAVAGYFKGNPNIRLMPYNNVPVWGHRKVLHFLYDRDLALPPAQNVLVTTLFLALRIGYRKIVVLGADHSWHETIALDEYNRVCLRDRHFYDKEVGLRPFTVDGSPDNIFTMDSLFFALGRMFEGYRNIQAYARTLDAEIVNASSTTYIDAFERKDIDTILATTAACA